MDSARTVNTLRDVILRRRSGLPIPDDIDLDELLEEAADMLEELEGRRADYDDDIHCDGCCCDDDDDDSTDERRASEH